METKYLGKGERDLPSVFKRQLERGEGGKDKRKLRQLSVSASIPKSNSGVGEGAGLPSADSVEQMMR